ncbi:dual specificity protein phosphatase 15 [Python bivittatus]|uniref:Dual specificity protein phosphatase 15 n=1 Tax=Python bivittatus TaxID=176946 RepID=A0A9F2WLV2_PYTBI|nr:dual specificity protein phosphatase 15 [Python bivittatus]
MGNGMNKILPGLFLGNIIDAKDLDQLSKNNITHIVSIHESPQPFIPGITYLRIVLPDTPEANILAGISRSTTIVLAYLMAVTQLGWHEALEAVKAVRPVANPNLGFCQQLEDFGRSQSVQKIRRRLERKYGGTPFHDSEAVRVLLPSSQRQEPPSTERALQALGPKSRSVKHIDSFLMRVKETCSCLPGCLK